MIRFLRIVAAVALAAAAALWLTNGGAERLATFVRLFYGTPHERYAASLSYTGMAETVEGRSWLQAAEQALGSARPVLLPRDERVRFGADRTAAAAYVASLRRGQRYIAEAHTDAQGAPGIFIDVFVRSDGRLRHIANAAAGEAGLAFEVKEDGEYVVRLQPELSPEAGISIALRSEPTLGFPVHDRAGRIQSLFGDPRDGGRRTHQGIDIFAPRGTPVVAAADGVVSRVGTNRLGGKVVWIARPARGELHYYAHLDDQKVTAGTIVDQGDVIGTVGNTGNAARTPPHLHFGIYAAGGAVDPLPYVAAVRQRHRKQPPRSARLIGSSRLR